MKLGQGVGWAAIKMKMEKLLASYLLGSSPVAFFPSLAIGQRSHFLTMWALYRALVCPHDMAGGFPQSK